MSRQPPSLGRRAFLEAALASGCAAAAGTFLLSMVPSRESAARGDLVPQGHRSNQTFLQPVLAADSVYVACPYGTLRLAGMFDPAPAGTPYFTPRSIPCEMCRDLPCVKACPTGALNPKLEDVRNAKMGVAVVDPNACLSWQGLRCEVCFRECPEAGRAITIETHPRELSKPCIFVPE